MHIRKQDIPVRIDAPGAIARQLPGFGDPSRYTEMGGEYFSLAAGTDIAPLLRGLEGDLCQAPHWGYVLAGELTVTYRDGTVETVAGGDLFHWPPGHSVRVGSDAEIVLFSPLQEHAAVLDHMSAVMAG